MGELKYNLRKMILIALLLYLLVIRCQPTEDNNTPTPSSVATLPNEQQMHFQTTIELTQLIAPTNTATMTTLPPPISSPTLQPTTTPLPTATLSPTPLATLLPDEAANQVMELLADTQDPNCLLPCWWGATPGQTQWQDIELFLSSFAVRIRVTPLGASVEFPLPEPIKVSGFDYNVVYVWNEVGVINEISIGSINISGYDAKTMVTLYGVPDEVWLNTRDSPVQGVLPFQLIVVYQQKGISFRYYLRATKIGEMVTACFPPGVVEQERPDIFPVGPRLFLWTPGVYKSIGEISPIPWERYFSLESKTDLTPQTLYEKFSNPNEPPCIETPAELWKYQ